MTTPRHDIEVFGIEPNDAPRPSPTGARTLGWATARIGQIQLTRAPVIHYPDTGTTFIGIPGGRHRGVGWSPQFGERLLAAVRVAAAGTPLAEIIDSAARPALPALNQTS